MRSPRVLFAALVPSIFAVLSATSATAHAQSNGAPEAAAPQPAVESTPAPASEAAPVVTPEPAAAEHSPLVVEHPWVVDADAAYFTTSDAFDGLDSGSNSLSVALTGTYRAEHVDVELTLPVAHRQYWYGDTSHGSLSSGNPTMGVYYAQSFSFGRLRAGASVSLPLTPEGGGDNHEVLAAAATRSYERPWLWVPQQITFAPSIRLANDEREGVQHVSELIVAPMVSTRDTSDKLQWVIQASQSIGYRVGAFRAGVRGLIVAFPRADAPASDDQAQLSVMPYVGGDFGTGYVDLGLNVNLDKPLGSLFDEGAVWGLRLRGGVRF